MPTLNPPDIVYCYKCGHPNAAWRATCENCGAQLISVASSPPTAPDYSRPVGVTLYIGFMVAYKAISLLGSLVSLSWLAILLILGQIIAAAGVWQMKQWGRKAFLVLMIIGISLSLLEIVAYNQQFSFGYIIATLAGTIVDGFFLYWLATHGNRFRA